MPEPFKNAFNPEMIATMGRHFQRMWPAFDTEAFTAEATEGLERLELKQRSNNIKRAMESRLPSSFKDAAPILLGALHPEDDVDLSGTDMDEQGIRGWAILPMSDYVGEHGTHDFDLGMDVQKELTKRFSAEFGIRHFILHDQERALRTFATWANDANYHVRRLASEGARPRLPWGMRLPALIENPAPLMPILETMQDDPLEYVRRSVANNLNDIAKDHPDMVAGIAANWLNGASRERERLIRHACRTLIKQGHAKTLKTLGYAPAKASLTRFEILSPEVSFGNALSFEFSVKSEAAAKQNVMLDYIIHHVKANGQTTPKVFKWKNFSLKAGEIHTARRKHVFKPITTRTYYPGTHRVEIQMNGVCLGGADFELIMPGG